MLWSGNGSAKEFVLRWPKGESFGGEEECGGVFVPAENWDMKERTIRADELALAGPDEVRYYGLRARGGLGGEYWAMAWPLVGTQ